jgi:phosphatidate cytidylyltransferase
MLKQRVITALLLLAVLLPALFASNKVFFAILAITLIACCAWEWARLLRFSNTICVGFGIALAGVLCGVAFGLGSKLPQAQTVFGALSVLWLVLLLYTLANAASPWATGNARYLHLGFAAVALIAAMCVVLLAHARGAWFLLSLLGIVWAADIGAYAAGRTMGRNKLAVKISPGKTWEGALGGWIAALVLAAVCARWPETYFGLLIAKLGMVWMLVGVTALVAVSVAGDLFESMLKRSAGMKDSSALLPGHGGVYDRIDALVPMLPMAYLLGSGF